jgi:hypothetical protein
VTGCCKYGDESSGSSATELGEVRNSTDLERCEYRIVSLNGQKKEFNFKRLYASYSFHWALNG